MVSVNVLPLPETTSSSVRQRNPNWDRKQIMILLESELHRKNKATEQKLL